jgi:hypothetical protein
MNDFFHEAERQKMLRFFIWFSEFVNLGLVVQKKYFPRIPGSVRYAPKNVQNQAR